MILSNIEKPLSFHKNNLQNNKIYLYTNQIKWILQKLREEKYPSDSKYIKDISKITINYDKEANLKNLPFSSKMLILFIQIKNLN